MSIDDIHRLPDEAFAPGRCPACELLRQLCLCSCASPFVGTSAVEMLRPAQNAIDRAALRDCISDVCVSEAGYAELEMSKAIAKAILESFDVRLKP